MNEGELSGRLGLTGWPAVAEEAIIARDCLLAAHVGSRLHVCHVSTAGFGRDHPRRQAQGLERHRRGLSPPPAAHRRPGRDLRPDLQGQPAAAHGRRHRGAAGRARRRHHRHRGHRPRAAPARGQGLRVGGGRLRDARPRDGAVDRAGDDGRHRPARLGRRRRADVVRPGPDRSGQRPRAADRGGRAGQPGALRPLGATHDRGVGVRIAQPQHPVRRQGAARPGDGDLPARQGDRARREARSERHRQDDRGDRCHRRDRPRGRAAAGGPGSPAGAGRAQPGEAGECGRAGQGRRCRRASTRSWPTSRPSSRCAAWPRSCGRGSTGSTCWSTTPAASTTSAR